MKAGHLALPAQKPVICDWLPWSHVFGGSHNFNKVVRFGGSLYIDDGKPLPALLPKTVRNLTDVSPTIYFSVPLAYALLVAELRDNAALRKSFFSRLQIIFYAGAALPQSTWDELERLAVMELGRPWSCCPPGARPRPRRPAPTATSRPCVPA
jgi:feruloyl-CoA synthase